MRLGIFDSSTTIAVGQSYWCIFLYLLYSSTMYDIIFMFNDLTHVDHFFIVGCFNSSNLFTSQISALEAIKRDSNTCVSQSSSSAPMSYWEHWRRSTWRRQHLDDDRKNDDNQSEWHNTASKRIRWSRFHVLLNDKYYAQDLLTASRIIAVISNWAIRLLQHHGEVISGWPFCFRDVTIAKRPSHPFHPHYPARHPSAPSRHLTTHQATTDITIDIDSSQSNNYRLHRLEVKKKEWFTNAASRIFGYRIASNQRVECPSRRRSENAMGHQSRMGRGEMVATTMKTEERYESVWEFLGFPSSYYILDQVDPTTGRERSNVDSCCWPYLS